MTIRSHVQHRVVCAFAAAASLILAPSADAETIHCGAADVQCLIAAINDANADPHKTTIRLAGGTYALTNIDNDTNGPNGLPSIVSPVTIDGGDNGTTIERTGAAEFFRILHVGATGRLTLNGVSLMGGTAVIFAGGDLLSLSGGALLNVGGVVTIANSAFDGNFGNGTGGAVFNDHGTLTILDSTFANNDGGSVGGLFNDGGVVDITRTVFEQNFGGGAVGGLGTADGDVRITQSHFTANNGGFFGGGIFVDGGTMSIVQTTIAGNVASDGGGLRVTGQANVLVRDSAFIGNGAEKGGAIANSDSTVDVANTTFARNVVGIFDGAAVLNVGRMTIVNSTFAENGRFPSGFPASVIASGGDTLLDNTIVVHDSEDESVQDCAGLITSLGNNLIGDPFAVHPFFAPCNITLQPSDLTGDAGLDDLADDGTPGGAHYPLLPDSQAIDVANDAACPKKDQIGQPRAPRCDIGAIEFRRSDVVTTTQ